jgi:hypothetical protein
MKEFVIFGDIYFTDDEALVRSVRHAGFFDPDAVEDEADKWGGDWLSPHYYNGKITFTKYHKENLNA